MYNPYDAMSFEEALRDAKMYDAINTVEVEDRKEGLIITFRKHKGNQYVFKINGDTSVLLDVVPFKE